MISDGPTRPTISDLHQAALRTMTEYLLDYPLETNRKEHRLSHVQALDQHLRPDITQEPTPEVATALQYRATEQARNLNNAYNRDIAFAKKQAEVAGFLNVIRQHITEPKITPAHVMNAMQVLLKQFDDKALAIKNAIDLTEKAELAANQLARIEKEATPTPSSSSSSSSNSSTSPSSSSSSSSQAPTTGATPLADAQSAAQTAKTAANEAKVLAEKKTDIDSSLAGSFRAYVAHVQSHRVVMEAIIHELQFGKKDEQLTTADDEITSAAWESVLAGKKARLADVERTGGRYAGLQARVADWNSKMPKALTSNEMKYRDTIVPYEDGESKERRKERLRQVAGFEPRTEQIGVKAVARDKALKESGAALSLAKQLHELEDERRAEFEDLGIKSIPKNKQTFVGAFLRTATGTQMWKTLFEDTPTPTNPNPPRRAMLEEGAPLAFPDRKQLATKTLVPGLERHLKMGTKEGYFVGQKTKATDEYQKVEDSDELSSMMEKLKKLRI